MNFFVADPEWGVWIIGYFFLGGIAAGSYFIAILVEWFGSEQDRDLARIAYWIAFPLAVLCGLFLIIDLHRPERFWHMLLKSEVTKAAFAEGFPFTTAGWRLAVQAPAFKYWSPMSAGSWGLSVFGACTFASFLATVWPQRWPGRWLQTRWPHRVLQVVGCAAGFFVASYTGGLLSATNQPVWSDTVWLAPLFLASAASTSLAAMWLIAWWKNIGTAEARARLAGAEPLALSLELVVLGVFVASLGNNLEPVLVTVRGNILVFGSLVVAVLMPLLVHARVGHRRWWGIPGAAACALLGGLLLRYGAVTTPGELLRRGPSTLVRFAPEQGRRVGEPGADIGNHGAVAKPHSKLSTAP
ncbi:MAG TPA: NrfD/PsrC family molybdoenzyme membrane anchor subunit [Gemmataceae bacterium]|nr:NrfD/PsrC family molybdoenzyme membrane anchor subunit [Gemmataceae bacterium]